MEVHQERESSAQVCYYQEIAPRQGEAGPQELASYDEAFAMPFSFERVSRAI